MALKFNYKQRIFICFFLLFTVFSVEIVLFEQHEERISKTEALKSTLDGYAEIIHSSIVQGSDSINSKQMYKLLETFPASMRTTLRVTILNPKGKVVFDDVAKDLSKLENHLLRPEIQKSLYQTSGSSIRMSASVGVEYFYYAKHYPDYYVRVAVPYTFEAKNI